MGRRRLGASSRSGKRSTSMGRKSRADRVESALRRADASLEAWFRRGAGVDRSQVGVDGADTETQSLGGLAIRHAGRYQPEDLDLPHGETVSPAEPSHGRRTASIAIATGL